MYFFERETLDELSLVNTSFNESQQANNSLKASLLAYNLDLIYAFAKLYNSMVSFRELFGLTDSLLKLIKTDYFPSELKVIFKKIFHEYPKT